MSAECMFKWVLIILCVPVFGFGQTKEAPILFNNPSFEGFPKAGQTPAGWYDCGPPGESAPDIQPGSFDVTRPASNGNSYLGLVVRETDTWESVAQRISRPLEINQCYEFSMDLCRSEIYVSPLAKSATPGPRNFVAPCKIRIWGGMGYCDKAELLYESSLITHTRWISYNARVSPKKGSYTFILIEAYYKTPILFPENGNILLDNLSPIKKVVCGPDKMPDPKPKLAVKGPATAKPATAKPTTTTPKPETGVKKPVAQSTTNEKIERSNMKKGKVFRLEKVYFDANKYEVKPESETELTALFKFLNDNPDVMVEVGGHTNNKMWPNEEFANELSTNRAKAVADWLIEKGIATERVQYKGYGWKYPIEPNSTEAGKKKNQRVEVKILTING